jgi:hypothetical protein
LRSWAQAHGTIVTWHEPELDVSGGTMSRPIFDRLPVSASVQRRRWERGQRADNQRDVPSDEVK